MIGVAFALQKTFGTSYGIEGAAFVRVLREFARLGDLHVDVAGAEERTLGGAAEISSRSDLHDAFSTALWPYVLHEAEDVQLEAMFRMEAARLVSDRFVPFDDVAPALRQLASLNVPCVALSGGWPSIDQRKAHAVGFTGPIIFAEDLGVEADAPAAFASVAKIVRLPADRIWFVGTDVRSEILPAAAAGMRTIWINRDEETFPSQRRAPDAVVTSFADLLEVLSESYTRGLLALRHILRTALDWRPGHFISGEDDVALADRERGEDAP